MKIINSWSPKFGGQSLETAHFHLKFKVVDRYHLTVLMLLTVFHPYNLFSRHRLIK